MYKVILHLDNGRHVFTCVPGEHSPRDFNRVLYDLTLSVERKLGHKVVELEVCRMALGSTDERRSVILHDGTRAQEAVVVLDTPDTPQAPGRDQPPAGPGYDVLAGAPVSRLRELRRTADWPRPTSTGQPRVQPTGRVVTPERKQAILESKDLAHRLEQHGLVVYAASESSWLAGAYALLEGV